MLVKKICFFLSKNQEQENLNCDFGNITVWSGAGASNFYGGCSRTGSATVGKITATWPAAADAAALDVAPL